MEIFDIARSKFLLTHHIPVPVLEKAFLSFDKKLQRAAKRDAKLRGQEIWPATTSLGPHESMLSCRAMRSNI